MKSMPITPARLFYTVTSVIELLGYHGAGCARRVLGIASELAALAINVVAMASSRSSAREVRTTLRRFFVFIFQ